MHNRSHLSVLIPEQAKKYGSRTAITYQDFGDKEWKTVSWNYFGQQVQQVSNALLNLGIKPQESIAIFAQNCVQHLYTDYGAYGVRVITVPFYATSSEAQIQYMINDAQVRILFVGEQEQYDKALRVFTLCSSLERIVVYDDNVRLSPHDNNSIYFKDFVKLGEGLPRQSEVEALYAQANYEDLCNILYTSGTTGDSKGVMLSYGQYAAAMSANHACVPVNENDRVINFLPFTHVFERGWSCLSLGVGAQLIVNTDPKNIQESMRQTHPTSMASVPRFWEKVYQAVKGKIDTSNPVEKKIFLHALKVGKRHNIDYLSKCKRPPLSLSLEYKILNKSILSLVRKQLGLENAHIFPTAGAYVSPEVETFVHSIGLNMLKGYGLTESLATVSCDRCDETYTVGSAGRPIDGIEIKIGADNEILLKGPTITPGYYKREALNAQAFDADGFFHTGDAGYMKDGELYLTERIKDLFKTSNGKYIAPQMIESLLLVDKFVDQIAVIADQRKFVSALIVPEFNTLEKWARDKGIFYNSLEELCANQEINDMMKERIDTLLQGLANYEKIKRFTLLPHHFAMDTGELTNTLKMRRPVIYKKYKDIIDKMYEENQ